MKTYPWARRADGVIWPVAWFATINMQLTSTDHSTAGKKAHRIVPRIDLAAFLHSIPK